MPPLAVKVIEPQAEVGPEIETVGEAFTVSVAPFEFTEPPGLVNTARY
jgi:hypothetical protein